jgi:hypothetical protein
MRERLHLPEPVVDLEGLEEFADGHLLVAGRQERFMPLPLGRQLSSRVLWIFLAAFRSDVRQDSTCLTPSARTN